MDKLIDMHIHTSYSDGEYKPDDVALMAIDKGIGTMAITDHDTIAGAKALNKDLFKDKIEIIDGIELSAKRDHGRMHILGYQIDLENEVLNKKMDVLRNNSLQSFLSIMEQIKRDYNIVFDYQDIQELIGANRNLGRPDLARLCYKYGYVKTIEEAFQKYLIPAKERVNTHYKGLEYPECLDLIAESGGISVLAHPKTLELSEKELLKLIKNMINKGLKGIEVYHSSHSKEQIELYHKIALEYGLLESGGSDYHGPFVKPNLDMGTGIDNNLKIKRLSLVDYLHKR